MLGANNNGPCPRTDAGEHRVTRKANA